MAIIWENSFREKAVLGIFLSVFVRIFLVIILIKSCNDPINLAFTDESRNEKSISFLMAN